MISFKHIILFLFLLLIPFKMFADNTASVGTPDANLEITPNGAAAYNLSIDIPNGGGFHPQIGLAYDSQATGYGNAGYGFNITGISVISMGRQNKFYDTVANGSSYLANSAYYLDGKRLLLQSGSESSNGAKYQIEGDPYTEITYNNDGSYTWFDVKSQDGTLYRYGYKDANAHLTFTKGGKNCCAAWYISYSKDKFGNEIKYTYQKENLCVLPKKIVYGINSTKPRQLSCWIEFAYTDISSSNVIDFYMGNSKGKISKKLSTITTKTNQNPNNQTTGSLYRKYTLSYKDDLDKTSQKYSRLTSIVESNEWGDQYNPVTIDWNALQAMSIKSSSTTIKTNIVDENEFKTYNRSFFSADLNKDGISDIISLWSVKEEDMRDVDDFFKNPQYTQFLHVDLSKIDISGKVTYESAPIEKMYLTKSAEIAKVEGFNACDFDGDGFSDLVFRTYNNKDGILYFTVVTSNDILNNPDINSKGVYTIKQYIKNYKENPSIVSTTMDVDGDGVDEIVYIEKVGEKKYKGKIVKYVPIGENNKIYSFDLSFDHGEPEAIFVGDYNNDGVQDMLVQCEQGYKIYYNDENSKYYEAKFTETNKYETEDSDFDLGKLQSLLEMSRSINQGDFNGDGQIDFIVVLPTGDIVLKLNNGNGTFTSIIQKKAFSHNDIDYSLLSFSNRSKCSLNVVDFDNDGRSDVVIEKLAGISHVDFDKKGNIDSNAKGVLERRWFKSNGTTLEQQAGWTCNVDCKTWDIFNSIAGDFDGDGAAEIASVGNQLNSASSAFNTDSIYIYKCGGDLASSGKIKTITDGFGVRRTISYKPATNPSVYTKAETAQNSGNDISPVNYHTIPLSVVSQMEIVANDVTKECIKYSYGNLKLYIGGKGMLGFESFTKDNQTLGTVENSLINEWNTTYWIPKKTTQTVTIGKEQSTKISDYHITSKGKKNYFAYVEKEESTDFDNKKVWTGTSYDTDKGVIKAQEVDNDEDFNMYKGVEYFYSKKYGGIYLPDSMYIFQKHSDDEDVHFVVNTYKYDAKGNVTKIVNNLESKLRLIETYTYDNYGNKLTESVEGIEGSGVKKIIKKYKYDSSGRFVIDEQTSPASSHIAYKYNIFGDMYEKIDSTVPSNLLVESYLNNRWNETTKKILVDNNYIEYSKAWEPTFGSGYYSVTETPNNAPWTKTVYDPFGREVYTSSVGLNGVDISKETTYNAKGEVVNVVNKTGKLTITGTYAYDERGRKISEELSSGKNTTYKYGKNTISTTTVNGTTQKTYDAWGNITGIVDPLDTYVEYKYYSNGQPSTINTYTNSGSCSSVAFEYDDNGHRTKLVDPDAGTMTYKYAADGTLLSQTDARGVTTNYSYDDLGRLTTKTYVDKSGNKKTQTNEYFTSGRDINRLKSQTYNGYKRTFTYDRFGKVTSETRCNYSDHACYTVNWTYNPLGQMEKVTYPGTLSDMSFNYSYDNNGFLKEIKLNNSKSVYSLKSYNGLTLETNTVTGVMNKTVDKDGYPYNYKLTYNSNIIDWQSFSYDKSTGNLYGRLRQYNGALRMHEKFAYDNMDRLMSVYDNMKKKYTMKMSYADNGNILNKSDVGKYTYNSNGKPHAVISVSNDNNNITSNTVTTEFDVNGKIGRIYITNGAGAYNYSYGPDDEKWVTNSWTRDRASGHNIEHIYFGGYEKITVDDVITEQYFLENGVVVISETVGRKDTNYKVYQTVTDNLGSIVAVYDEHKKAAFRASFDAWGKPTVYTDKINFQYGYTGHEMLTYFGLIDMGARLYDPTLGRFLSCDNYVQAPDNSQNFNRYSYCFNNPLKYTDPDGNIVISLGVASAIAMVAGDMMYAAHNKENVLKAGLISGASAAATIGIGSIFGKVGSLGHELCRACAHGFSSGVFSAIEGNSFGSGFVSGATSSLIGSFAQSVTKTKIMGNGPMIASTTVMGGVASWATGGSFLEGAIQGYQIGVLNHSMHGKTNEVHETLTKEQIEEINSIYLSQLEKYKYADQFYESLGGEIPEMMKEHPNWFRNTCAARLSDAFNRSGIKYIPHIEGNVTLEGAGGMHYFMKAKNMKLWLEKIYGSPVRIQYSSQKLPISLIFQGGFKNVSGHIDVIGGDGNSAGPALKYYTEYKNNLKYYLWKGK